MNPQRRVALDLFPLQFLSPSLTNASGVFMSGAVKVLSPHPTPFPLPCYFLSLDAILFLKYVVGCLPQRVDLNTIVILGRPFPVAFPSGRHHVCSGPYDVPPCQPASRRASGELHTCYEQHDRVTTCRN